MTEPRPRFVLLEDSPADAEIVAAQLRAGGVDCELIITDTEPTFRAALDGPVDLVLSDHNLTTFDSRRAYRLTRERHPDVPFIVVSGTMGEDAAIEALRSGATDYVLKSRLSKLVPCVMRALDEARKLRERREVEAALRASEERHRAFLDATTDMVWDADATGRITSANAAAARITGLPLAAFVGRPFISFVPEDDAARARLERVFNGGEAIDVLRHGWRNSDGTVRICETTATPVFDEVLGAMGARGITRDITEHARLEDQFRQAQRMEAIGTLAGGIAHDFNNALTTILGFTELLTSDLSPDDVRHVELAAIRKAAEYSAALTRQLLAFSRRQVLAPVRLDLRIVISDLERMLRRVIGENIRLEVVSPVYLSQVLADRGQLEQVLMNLAVNARDAMPDGGKLTLSVEDVTVSHATPFVDAGHYVLLTVRDSGVGMPPDVASRVFEPFFTTKPKGSGTGLGLSTVYGIVKQSGGHIAVDSTPGRGAAFLVYWPILEPANPAGIEPRPAADAERDALPGGPEMILLVEDETAVRNLVRQTLVARGYQVIAVASAEEAREMLSRTRPHIDLLLTDAVLRGESGPDLASALREQIPGLKVLFMSGYIEQTPQRARQMEDAGFLQKPFGPRTLAEKVRETLDR